MKLSTHIFGLLVVFAAFTLIGCSSDKSPQKLAQQCIGAGTACTQTVVSYCMTNPASCQQVAAIAQAQNVQTANGIATQLPPGAATVPQQLPLPGASAVQQQQRKVQAAMDQASANPMSSYYVDPSAEDVPARSSISEQLARMAVNNLNRQTAPQPAAPTGGGDANAIQ